MITKIAIMLPILIVSFIIVDRYALWADGQLKGPRQTPITLIRTKAGQAFEVYDIDAGGQPCRLITRAGHFALSCAWNGN